MNLSLNIIFENVEVLSYDTVQNAVRSFTEDVWYLASVAEIISDPSRSIFHVQIWKGLFVQTIWYIDW